MGAVISECGTYRYRLHRGEGRTLMFLMVNPSTADAEQDDATIRKCLGFAERNGFGRIVVGNLFAYRAKDVNALRKAIDPVDLRMTEPDGDAARGGYGDRRMGVAQ